MNQYIIDETMLQAWREGCVNLSNPHTNDDICKKCEYHGTGMRKECCDFDDNTMEKIFRSHPYQSERDTVLDAVFASMDTFFGNIPMDSDIIQWAISKQDSFVTAAMATYLESRKLRQAGEP